MVTSILVAPDKFKGSLSAPLVARALGDGLRDAAPSVLVTELPVADGGDGTVDAVLRAGLTAHHVRVEGPIGDAVDARIAIQGTTGVVEIAETSGLCRVPAGRSAPLHASTYGLGQAILAAVELGCRDIVVGLGGSATTDGGAGMLQALGGELTTHTGEPIARGGRGLRELAHIDLTRARDRLRGVQLVAACDVTNPLCGETGAAYVYGPQKGASPDEAAQLDRWLQRFAILAAQQRGADHAGSPGAGAAGGTGFGLLTLGAHFQPGAELILNLIGFQEQLANAQLVIAGEGSLDLQSLLGKAPIAVAKAAVAAGVPVIAVAGRVTLSRKQLRGIGIRHAYALTDHEPDVQRCHDDAADLLRRIGAQIATDGINQLPCAAMPDH